MSRHWDFTLWLQVHDENALLQAARAHPDAADMSTEEFYTDEGEIDIKACLVMLLDPGKLPGCTIHDSGAQQAESFEVALGDEDRDPRPGTDDE